jgi:hypothetical protein
MSFDNSAPLKDDFFFSLDALETEYSDLFPERPFTTDSEYMR